MTPSMCRQGCLNGPECGLGSDREILEMLLWEKQNIQASIGRINADHVIESQGQCHRHFAGCLVDLEVNNNPNSQDEQQRIDYRTEN